MVIVDQVMDNMVHEGADDKAKDITEVEDEGTKLVGVMMCYKCRWSWRWWCRWWWWWSW